MSASEGLVSRSSHVPGNLTRQLANSAMGREGVIALWFGEPDVPTPSAICKAAQESLDAGETFYTQGLGTDFLRQRIAGYQSQLTGKAISSSRIAVTLSASNALNLAFQSLLSEGDKLVTTLPIFPNLLAIPSLHGASIETVGLRPTPEGWTLDIEELIRRVADAKVVLINSPNNPTGWQMPEEHWRALLHACRQSGCWIVSDEVYARLTFDRPRAFSVLEIAEEEDRVVTVNSFSKTWAMTGWRLGWLTLPPSLVASIERIMEFSVSCVPTFSQRAAAVAIQQGERFIEEQNLRYCKNLEVVRQCLSKIERVELPTASATFYSYFRVRGVDDNMAFATRLIDEAMVGIAPGKSFDASKEDWFRLCVAVSKPRLETALARIETFLS